jgi:DNA invertase Pin-like site-specific DNA recombinase
MAKLTAYLRVSGLAQGRSGLGLEAQRAAVMAFAAGRHEIIAEFVEVESGANDDRPQLAAALHRAKVTNSTICIAKLDRLSRHAGFLFALRDSGVRFIAADMPDANEMTVGIMAVIAEGERKMIAQRTREALAARRARGGVVGNPANLVPGRGQQIATRRAVELADEKASDLMVVIEDIRASGITTHRGIARELQARQVQTPRGGDVWHLGQVQRILNRIEGR